MAGIWFSHMEYIWGLGCKPHLCPHASHMTLHMAYIWVTYDNAIGVTPLTQTRCLLLLNQFPIVLNNFPPIPCFLNFSSNPQLAREDIKRQLSLRLSNIDGKRDATNLWAAVRQLTGRQQEIINSDGITAESLNNHYVNISTDTNYIPPTRNVSSAKLQTWKRTMTLNLKSSEFWTVCTQQL